MITIIYGAKGSGKTKKMIDAVNAAVDKTKGIVVFLSDTNRYMPEIRNQVKKINTAESEIFSEAELVGFIKGIIACNNDVSKVFIDGAHRMCNKDVADMETFFEWVCEMGAKSSIEFVVTASKDLSEMPEFLKKYI